MRKKNGFTIVELLVVLAVIGILAAVLIPVFQGAVEDARQARQTAELEQANKALAMHVALHGEDSLEWEGMLCGEKILQAIRGELEVNDLSVTDAEEGFLAYDVRTAKVNVFDEIGSFRPAAARPDLILDGRVLLEPELLDSFYGPVLEGGSFEGFLTYVKKCPKSFSDPLKQYAAGRVFVGSKDGKDQVLTLNEGQDLLPVFAKTENNTLPADFYRYVSAETAISLEGKQHAADQLYRLAEGEPDLLDYGIQGADLTLGECTLAALIRSWSVVGFTVDAGTRTITLFNENGPIVPELPEEPGTDPGNPDPENPGTDPTDPDPEEPFELTVRIVKKAKVTPIADVSIEVLKDGAGSGKEKIRLDENVESEELILKEGEDFEVGDCLGASLPPPLNQHLLGGWYIPSGYSYENEEFFYQRGLTEYVITKEEALVELWLVPGNGLNPENLDESSSFIPDLTTYSSIPMMFYCVENSWQKFLFILEEELVLTKFGERGLTVEKSTFTMNKKAFGENKVLIELNVDVLNIRPTPVHYPENDLYHVVKIYIEKNN